MRFNINLASHPYEDSRQFWIYWGAGLSLLALITMALVYLAVIGYMAGASDRQQISQLRSQVDRLDQEKNQAMAMLNRSDNRIVRDRSRFLNQLFEQKSLSWTLIFEQLEEVMPAHLHVISIHPGLTDENDMQLKLVVGGESREQALDLVRKMENSKHFKQTRIDAEKYSDAESGKKDRVEFDIDALYVPTAPTSAGHGGSD
jgi:type IV pilus assembly protein PilN